MTLKLRRIDVGLYSTEIHGTRHVILQSRLDARKWLAVRDSIGGPTVAEGATRKEVVEKLEVLARAPQDRATSDFLKLARRGEIRRGSTEITIDGVGRCLFLSHTRKDDGSEWIDVLDPKGRNRAVRPDRIKTVHRARKTGVR